MTANRDTNGAALKRSAHSEVRRVEVKGISIDSECRRTFEVKRDAVDLEKRTVTVAFSSETPVKRWWGVEVLGHRSGEVDLSILRSGAPFLMDHNPEDQRGVVESATIDGDGIGRCILRISRSDRGTELLNDIADDIRSKISVGYRVNDLTLVEEKDGEKTYRVTSWQPFEVSSVSIPADPTVGVGRSVDFDDMNKRKILLDHKPAEGGGGVAATPAAQPQTPASSVAVGATFDPATERKRVADIMRMGRQHRHVTAEQIDGAIERGVSVDVWATEILRGYQDRPVQLTPEIGMKPKEVRRYSLAKAILKRSEGHQLDGLEKECHDEVVNQLRGMGYTTNPGGFYVPWEPFSQRGQTVGTAADGGRLVGTQLDSGNFIEILRNTSVLPQLGARMLTGLVGNIDIPRQTGSVTGANYTETGTISDSALTFDLVSLSPKRVGTRAFWTKQLLAQSTPDIENLVRSDILQVLALLMDQQALSGSGSSNQPTGLINISGVGSADFGGANGGAPTWDGVIAMQRAINVANANIGTRAYLITSQMEAKMKTTLKAAGIAGYILESGGPNPQSTINGFPAIMTNQLPSNLTKGTGTSLSATVFGNFNDLLVAMWGGLDIVVDPYTGAADGKVWITAQQFFDVDVRRGASFAVSKDGITA